MTQRSDETGRVGASSAPSSAYGARHGAEGATPSRPDAKRDGSSLISDPAVFATGVPFDEFRRLRMEGGVTWVTEKPLWRHSGAVGRAIAGAGYWAVTRYEAIRAVSQQPEIFSSAAAGAFLTDPQSPQHLHMLRQLLLNMDAPEHTRLRASLAPAFARKTIDRLRPTMFEHARTIVADLPRGETFDAVRRIAAELPLRVLADFMGMPRSDTPLLHDWSNHLVGFDDPEYGGGSVLAFKRTVAEIFDYARRLAQEKRRRPGDDLLSFAVSSSLDGKTLSEAEIGHLCLLLVAAGEETSRHLLSGGLLALTEWPEEKERICRDRTLTASAVEEMLRWVTPIMLFRRTAVHDVELEGQSIGAGDKVVLYYISANRDERVFPEPDRFCIARAPNPQIAFGVGSHFCLGAYFARHEALALFEALHPHLRGFQRVGPIDRLESNFMNGIKHMPAVLN